MGDRTERGGFSFGLGPTVGVDRSFSDGRDGLNVAGFINVWGRYDRFVLSANVMYTDTTDSDTYRFPGTSQLPAIDVAGSVDTKQFMGTLQGAIVSSTFLGSLLMHLAVYVCGIFQTKSPLAV